MIRLRAANAKKHTVGSLATFSNQHRWMLDGACVNLSPQHADMLFFPTQGCSADPAREVCDACPVLARCRAYGIANPWDEGVWGGLNQKQRRRAAVDGGVL